MIHNISQNALTNLCSLLLYCSMQRNRTLKGLNGSHELLL